MNDKPTYEELEKRILKLEQAESERKHSEDELQKKETTIQSVFDAAPIGICIMKNRVYQRVNKNWRESFGYTEENLIGKTTEFLYESHEEYQRVGKELYKDLFKKGSAFVQTRIKRSNGELRDVDLIAKPLDSHDIDAGTVVIIHDTTERKRSEEALRESEARLRDIFDGITDGLSLLDKDLNIIRVNSQMEQMYAHQVPLEGKKCYKAYQQRNELCPWCPSVFTLRTGKVHTEIVPYPSAEEPSGWIELSTYPIKDGTQQVVGIVEHVKDITERKRFEEVLRENEEKYRLIAENTADQISVMDMNLHFTYISPNIMSLRGFTVEESMEQTLEQVLTPESMKLSLAVFEEEMQLEASGTADPDRKRILELEEYRKDGSIVWVEASFSFLRNKDHKPVAILIVSRDITERKHVEKEKRALEERLQQADKLESIGTLAGGIAHDFNNILFPIVGYTELLLADLPEDSPFRESLYQIFAAAMRAKELVKQILAFSLQDNHEIKLMRMQPVIREALKLIRSTIPTSIEIKQYISKKCGIIKADPTRIHQIVMNLATNAYHAMQDTGGELKVKLKEVELGEHDVISPELKPGAYACLTVSDTGTGMDKSVIDKIFDPFFTTKEPGKGTGLGLSVIHGIVQTAGGSIHVYSEPGKGSEFHVYLPVVKSSFEQQVIQTKKPIQVGTERILLVDDEKAIAFMEKQMLERLGYSVVSRNSSVEALEVFRADPNEFDVVITDMAMPKMSGDKLAGELIKIRSDIPVILCTGFSERMSEQKAADLGIKGFLMKPIVMKDLSDTIREVLGNTDDSVQQ